MGGPRPLCGVPEAFVAARGVRRVRTLHGRSRVPPLEGAVGERGEPDAALGRQPQALWVEQVGQVEQQLLQEEDARPPPALRG